MERLILQYTVGDGYSYYAENTVPIVYKDKQSAMDDFTITLLEYIDKLEIHRQESEKLGNKQSKLHQRLSNLQRHPKKSAEIDELNSQFLEAHKAYSEHNSSLSNEFEFGGTTLEYSDFLYRSDDTGKNDISTPSIFTLDEFFFSPENTLQTQVVSKPKMK